MRNLKQQIENFWKNNATISQSSEILKMLEESEKEWKKTLQSEYEQILAGKDISGQLTAEQKKKIWEKLSVQQTNMVRLKTAYKHATLYRWTSVACLAFLTCLYVYKYKQNAKPAGKRHAELGWIAVPRIIEKKNFAGRQEKKIILPDSSTVWLSAGSIIRYPEHFEPYARGIQLEGKALFEVRKDPSRPFTVTAGGFATTALGTRFIVDALAKDHVSIRLLRGKVVVRASSASHMKMKPVYLVPSQQLNINIQLKRFNIDIVSNNNTGSIISSLTNSRHKDKTEQAVNHNIGLSFDKADLSNVFQAMEKYYEIRIVFDKAEVAGLSFTGSFEPLDKPEFALNVICGMNGLSFTKKSGYILITK